MLADVTGGFHEVPRVRGVLHSRAQAEGAPVLHCLMQEHVSWEHNRLVSPDTSVWLRGSHGVRGDTSQVWGWIGLIRGVERSRVAAGRVARFGLSFAAA